MDVRSGDVLAMVSSPAFDPNDFAGGFRRTNSEGTARLNDPKLRPEINRATQENYAPGSIFKTVVALAALENGLEPRRHVHNPENPEDRARLLRRAGVPSRTRAAGRLQFQARLRSFQQFLFHHRRPARRHREHRPASRKNFISASAPVCRPGRKHREFSRPWTRCTARLARRRHGERVHRPGRSGGDADADGRGVFGHRQRRQGFVAAARRPHRAARPGGRRSGDEFSRRPGARQLGVHPRSLQILRDAMLGGNRRPEGTGKAARAWRACGFAARPARRRCRTTRNRIIGYNFWFASFAPYENPQYAVVVMVQSGQHGSGGLVCAPIAHDIYETILKKENARSGAQSGKREIKMANDCSTKAKQARPAATGRAGRADVHRHGVCFQRDDGEPAVGVAAVV